MISASHRQSIKKTACFFMLLVCALMSFSCAEENEVYLIQISPKSSVTVLQPTILYERNDVVYFAGIDSLRGLILSVDGLTKQIILARKEIENKGEQLCNLSEVNPEFTGTIEYIKILFDGSYLIYEQRLKACHRLWKFNPETEQLRCVFTYRNEFQYLKYNWGLEDGENEHTLYLSEYGVSNETTGETELAEGSESAGAPDSSREIEASIIEETIGLKGDATKIWKSVDCGESWMEWVDFKRFENTIPKWFHIHGLYYDNSLHRLYVTSGDGNKVKNRSNKCLWWTNDGLQWHYRDWSSYWGKKNNAFANAQLISLFVADDFILAGGDDYNNCIYRINKAETPNEMELERVYRYDPLSYGLITQYTSRFKRLSNGMIATMLINGDRNGLPRQLRLIATRDGYKWFELFNGKKEDGSEHFYPTGIFEEWNGCLYFLINEMEDRTTRYRFIKMALPNE